MVDTVGSKGQDLVDNKPLEDKPLLIWAAVADYGYQAGLV